MLTREIIPSSPGVSWSHWHVEWRGTTTPLKKRLIEGSCDRYFYAPQKKRLRSLITPALDWSCATRAFNLLNPCSSSIHPHSQRQQSQFRGLPDKGKWAIIYKMYIEFGPRIRLGQESDFSVSFCIDGTQINGCWFGGTYFLGYRVSWSCCQTYWTV